MQEGGGEAHPTGVSQPKEARARLRHRGLPIRLVREQVSVEECSGSFSPRGSLGKATGGRAQVDC